VRDRQSSALCPCVRIDCPVEPEGFLKEPSIGAVGEREFRVLPKTGQVQGTRGTYRRTRGTRVVTRGNIRSTRGRTRRYSRTGSNRAREQSSSACTPSNPARNQSYPAWEKCMACKPLSARGESTSLSLRGKAPNLRGQRSNLVRDQSNDAWGCCNDAGKYLNPCAGVVEERVFIVGLRFRPVEMSADRVSRTRAPLALSKGRDHSPRISPTPLNVFPPLRAGSACKVTHNFNRLARSSAALTDSIFTCRPITKPASCSHSPRRMSRRILASGSHCVLILLIHARTLDCGRRQEG
jgi:hypothetical protein